VAGLEDAPAMGRVMVETFLAAHRGQVPEEALEQRRREWTPEVSARSWARTLSEIASQAWPRECLYVAEDEAGEVVGLAMGGPMNGSDSLRFYDHVPESAGEVYALYVHPSRQQCGFGRRLVQAVAGHLAKVGMPALVIGCLAANAPARCFYEAMGGVIVGERTCDDGPEVVYGWEHTGELRERPSG
jgi:ribosomal protein S18 acetylase RimI-like enzyme